MKDHTSLRILRVKSLPHSRGKYHGELKSLALVNTHDPHCVGLFVQNSRLSVVHVIFLQLLDIADEIKQPLIARPLEGCRFLREHLHIRRALSASRHGRNPDPVSGFLYDLSQQIVNRRVRNSFPEILCLFVKRPELPAQTGIEPVRFIVPFMHAAHIFTGIQRSRLIKRYVRKRQTDLRKFLLGEAAEARCQHRCKREILACVIQNLEVIQQYAHLVSLKVSFPAHRVSRNPLFCQNGGEILRPAPDTSCQDHDIPVLHPPVSAAFPVRDQSVRDQLPYPSGDHPGFRSSLIAAAYPFPVKKQQFRHFVHFGHFREGRSRIQSCAVVVLDSSQFFFHDFPEDMIDALQHFSSASEVLMQVDPLFDAVVKAVGMIFLHEELRPGEAEAVDTLLHIPHHEDIIFPVCHT